MVINPHMVVVQVQVGDNIVEDILLDGGSNVNIMMKELWKMLGLPNSKPTPCTLWMVDKPSPNRLDLSKISKSKPMGFHTLQHSR
jgi:hypothetical protein